MDSVLWSLITVLAWGVWLVPLQLGRPLDAPRQTLFITLGNLALAGLVAWSLGWAELDAATFASAFVGGVIWAGSGVAAVVAVRRLGMARAMGTWAPLNILTSMAWGLVLFGEFRGLPRGVGGALLGCVGAMMVGITMVVSASEDRAASMKVKAEPSYRGARSLGWLAALIAGVGWGSYFIPIRLSETSAWVAAFPLAIGMAFGALLPAVGSLTKKPAWWPTALAAGAGLIWAVGNYGSLQLMEAIGTGRGFAIAQACIVVNALAGMLLFRRPRWGTRSARRILVGVCITAVAAAGIGLVR